MEFTDSVKNGHFPPVAHIPITKICIRSFPLTLKVEASALPNLNLLQAVLSGGTLFINTITSLSEGHLTRNTW